MDISAIITKYALQNAIRFKGKANPGAIIGKVLAEKPELKKDVPSLQKKIKDVLKRINSLSVEEQLSELEKIAPELLVEKKQKKPKELPPLKNTDKVVMRFEPSPSGPLHIGHAYVLSLNSEYCRKYNGKLILRIADTNPKNIYESSYELIPKDAEWLTKGNVNKVVIQSDRLETYYKYAEEVIKKSHAYVCTCKPDFFREAMLKMIPCPCRDLGSKEHLKRWKKMFTEYKEGGAVVRIKTNIKHNNPAMRDWPALRINEAKHPRQGKKYRVWPLMNFAVAVDDHELSITHAIRAKEHMDNEKRQKFLFDYMCWKMPEHLYIGRINFKDLKVSCSKTRPLIDSGHYSGWDDVRLPFLMALKRRGYQPDTFIKYALDVGVSQNDKTVSGDEFFKTINAFNKENIDDKAYRFFFVDDPVEITIEGAPEQEIELNLHPDNKKGGRTFKTKDIFYINKSDYKGLKEKKLYRLMDCLNFVKKGNKFVFGSLEYEKFKGKGAKIMHWLPKEKLLAVEVLMPDNTIRKGVGEKTLKNIKTGTIVQLERFSFAKLDKKTPSKLLFLFTHK